MASAQGQPEYYERALGLFQGGDPALASQVLQEGLRLNPDHLEGWLLLGETYLQRGLADQAIPALSTALSLQPTPKAHLLLAQAYNLQGKYPEAIRHYQAVLEAAPQSPEADHARRGLRQIGQSPEEAKEARAHFDEAVRFLKQNQLEEALKEVQALLTLLPEHLVGLALQGTILARQGKRDAAIESLQRAVSIEPTYYPGHYQLATLYDGMEQAREAILAYQRVVHLNPQSPEGRAAQRRLRQIGESPEAAERAGELIAQAQGFADALFLVKALDAMQGAIELVPDNPNANFFMGSIQTDLGLLDEAVQSYQRVITVEPGSYAAFFKLGFVYQLKGMFKEAAVVYLAARALGKDAPEAQEAQRRLRELGGSPEVTQRLEDLFRRGQERLAKGDLEGAASTYREASLLVPENVDAHYQLALVLRKAGRNEEAIGALTSALSLNPKLIQAHYTLGLIFEEQGRLSEALDSYKQAAAFGKGTKEGQEAQERAELLEKDLERIGETNLHINRANELAKGNDLEGAIREYLAAVALAPNVAKIHADLGSVYYRSGQMEEAFGSLRAALALEPTMVQARFPLGLVYESRGLLREAIEEFQRVLSLGTDEKEVGLARKALEGAVKRFLAQDESLDLVQTGMEQLKRGGLTEALKSFERASALDPRNFQAQFQLGLLYEREIRMDEAILAFQRATEIRPWDGVSHQHLARLYEVQQSYEKAIAEYQIYEGLISDQGAGLQRPEAGEGKIGALRERWQKAQGDARVHFNQALQHVKDQKLEMAGEEVKAALFLDPTNYLYPYNQAIIYGMQKQKDKARGALRFALSLNPEYGPAHLRLGLLLEELRFYRAAQEEFDKAIQLGREDQDLAVARESKSRVEASVERIKMADSHRSKAFELTKKGERDEAIKEYLKANEIEPDASVYFNLGILYEEKGEMEPVEEAFRRAVELKGDDVSFHVRLADFYRNQDRMDEAIKEYSQAIEVSKDPKSREAVYAKNRLESLRKRLSVTVNHGFFNYDSNRGNSDSQRFAGISSNFGLSLGYPLLQRRRLSLPVNLSVQNYFDHRLKFFFNSESLSLSLQYQPMDNYSARVGYSFSYSQTNSGPSSYGHSMSFDGSRSGRWPTQTALHYDFLRNTSLVTRLLDSARHTGRLSLSQSLPVVGGGLGFSYTYSQSNTVRRDQENTAHSLSLTYSRSILANLGGNLGYSFTLTDFSNPDAQGITRKNVFNGINAGLSYSVSPGFSLSASYSFQTSRTNLRAPTEALEDILTGQVISLNKYKKHLIGISASLSF